MKICAKCRIDNINGVIHEHHINGIHNDNRPENKMFLCANCHMTLHWKRWKLSDIGLQDVKIKKYYPSLTERIFRIPYPLERDLREDIQDLNEEIVLLTKEIKDLKDFSDKKISNLNKTCINLKNMMGYYNYELQNLAIVYINEFAWNKDSLDDDNFRIWMRQKLKEIEEEKSTLYMARELAKIKRKNTIDSKKELERARIDNL